MHELRTQDGTRNVLGLIGGLRGLQSNDFQTQLGSAVGLLRSGNAEGEMEVTGFKNVAIKNLISGNYTKIYDYLL